MTKDEIKDAVLRALSAVAPEMDAATLDAGESFRDQLDIDSMDFLNYVIGLHEALKIDIPELDYPKLSSLDGAVAYVAELVGASTIDKG
jgi:acyl carrier protein